jgi:hypothetical protein
VRLLSKTKLIKVTLALTFAGGAPFFAQSTKCPTDAESRRIVLTIAINHYKYDDHWPLLTSAVNDADSLEHVLESKFGYQSYESLAKLTMSDRLREKNATKDAIDVLVQDDLPKLLCPNDDFILFFSGHGDSRPYQTGSFKGENGYLIPYDGRDQGVSSLIEVKAFLEEVGHLPARHILVILDACHSGIAVEDAQQGMKASGDYQAALESRNSRKVIVSALADQTASDKGTVLGHSLFGGVLFQGLDQGLAAKGQDFIADSQLGEFVKQGVAQQSRLQLPDWVPFLGNEGGSLILKMDQDLAGLYRTAMQSLVAGDFDTFRLSSSNISLRSPNDPKTLELQYRLALSQGRVDMAQDAIEKLRLFAAKTHADSDSLPFSRQDMLDIKHQLSFWRNALAIPVSATQQNVTIHAFTGETEKNLLPLSGSIDFTLEPEANLFFKLRAKKEATFVYVFRIDKLGRIHSETDFLRRLENPVVTDSETLSVLHNGPESDDIQEWHFIFTSRQIDAYESAPGADDLAGATHFVVTIRPEQ